MLCNQCEQASQMGEIAGCSTERGTCGKDSTTSDLQDRLIYQLKGIAAYARRARTLGVADNEAGRFIIYALSTTLTNANFDTDRFIHLLQEAAQLQQRIKTRYEQSVWINGQEVEKLSGPAAYNPPSDREALLDALPDASTRAGVETVGEDVIALRSLLMHGIKGVAAHAYHAHKLGFESVEVYKELERLLDYLGSDPVDVESMIEKTLDIGTLNFMVMELLDDANSSHYGSPIPSRVRTSPVAGKAILITGHDLAGIAALLEATQDRGIQIYTHGDMLPAHSYPALKKYQHLIGNYGGAWYEQQENFESFPGPILVSSGCIAEPRESYRQRLFTMGPVGWPQVRHIEDNDFSPLIDAAIKLPGFSDTTNKRSLTTGYSGDTLSSLSDRLTRAIKYGAIKHIFLIAGCDSASDKRNYYGEFVDRAPRDTIVLALGCIKHRFSDREHGDIDNIPRLLDVGQSHDSYSVIKLAVMLTEGLECRLSELPISLVVSWFEQRAITVLLTFMALGFQTIRLGPELPPFLTPAVLERLNTAFNIQLITTAEADIKTALHGG